MPSETPRISPRPGFGHAHDERHLEVTPGDHLPAIRSIDGRLHQGRTTGILQHGERSVALDGRPIVREDLVGRAVCPHHRIGEPERAIAGGVHRRQVVRDEDQRRAALHDLADPVEALLLEAGITHREHFVDQQDRRLEEGSDGEAEPNLHPARIELDGSLDCVTDLGEVDDVVELRGDLLLLQSQDGAVEVDVLESGQIRMDPASHLEEHACTARGSRPTRRCGVSPG